MIRRGSWPIARLRPPDPADVERAKILEFAGDLGEAITITGTVTRKGYVHSSRYGTLSHLIEIDCGTSIVITFTNARWADTTRLGEHLTLTGTVKDHQYWRGIPETVLRRPKRIDNPTHPERSGAQGPAEDGAAGWPAGERQVRRRFPDHPNPAAPPLPTPPREMPR